MRTFKPVLLTALCAVLYGDSSESFKLAEMISNYAKVVTNKATLPTLENERNTTTQETYETPIPTTTEYLSLENSTEPIILSNDTNDPEPIPEYEDFDDLEEVQNNATTRQTQYNTMLKFFNGMISLLALMYHFSGKGQNLKPQKLRFKNENKPRGSLLPHEINNLQEPSFQNGKYYPIAQDRFNPDTAAKKFKKQALKLSQSASNSAPSSSASTSDIDQQYQPIDTYPPYNPFSSSNSETYNQDNIKTSYDADSDQYKQDKNPMNGAMTGNNMNVDVQPSYSYEIPYEPQMSKPKYPKQDMMQMNNDVVDDSYQPWKNSDDDHYPVYQTMKSKYPNYDSQPMKMKDEHPPWKTSMIHGNGGDDDDDGGNDMDFSHYPPEKPKQPMYNNDDDDDNDNDDGGTYQPWKHNMATDDSPPKKSKRPMYKPPMKDDNDDDGGADDQDSRQPWKNQDDDHHHHPVYHHDFHDYQPVKKPINYHDFIIEEHPEEEEHKVEEEDRDSKRPYSHYFLGRKLWYIPLLFSVYFIIYIGALVLKSVGRHKIQFPEKLWELHHDEHHEPDHHRRNRKINLVTENVDNAIENLKNKYM